MKAGDEVLLSEVAAGRDESEFPDADTFVVDRNPNRHVSFGVGIHRCPGSHLARITFSEMISGVLERMPDYHIDPDAGDRLPRLGDGRRVAAHAGDVHAHARAPLPLTRVVDLSLSDEQEQLVEAFRVFFAKECPPTVVRDAEEAGGFDARSGARCRHSAVPPWAWPRARRRGSGAPRPRAGGGTFGCRAGAGAAGRRVGDGAAARRER